MVRSGDWGCAGGDGENIVFVMKRTSTSTIPWKLRFFRVRIAALSKEQSQHDDIEQLLGHFMHHILPKEALLLKAEFLQQLE